MAYESVVISSGHGKYVRGASGILDEVDEARRVVEAVADELRDRNVEVKVFHDDVSKSQGENLERIVDYHNGQDRELDISVHFNAYVETLDPMGTEVLYVSQSALASQMSLAIAEAGGFKNRGAKKRTDLYFLNSTDEPAILLEICFVDSEADVNLYRENFDSICESIAEVLSGEEQEQESGTLFTLSGKVSWFGGPDDNGVAPDEGLAFITDVSDAPHLFLPYQPEGTTGLARRLNPETRYVACRWDYDQTPREMLLKEFALVRASRTGLAMKAHPADWGPHEDTDRIADLSPSLMEALEIQTDDEVEVVFPYYSSLF